MNALDYVHIDLSTTNLHPRQVSGGVQIACTYTFTDGTKKRMTGFGPDEKTALEKLKANLQKEEARRSFGDALFRGTLTVEAAIEGFLDDEESGVYISRKTGKPKSKIDTWA